MIVVVQAVRIPWSFLRQRWNLRAVSEEDIEVAVVVIVQQGHAARNAVDNRLVTRGSVVENEIDPGVRLAIFKTDFTVVGSRVLSGQLTGT